MTDPLDDSAIVAHERGFRRELFALLLLFVGVVVVVCGVWQFDWRAGVVTLGAFIAAAGVVLGIEGD